MVKKDCVIGIDCSTSASKAIIWDKAGNCIAEGRYEIPLLVPRPEWAEQEAEKWWDATVRAVKTAVRQVDKNRIGAIGITHQRESFVPLDSNMKPLRNGILWLDTRAVYEVEQLKTLGAEKIHKKTGLFPNLYASNVKIMWIRENEPRLFESVYKFMDVFAFLAWKFTGRMVTSWPSADPMGLVNMEDLCWDDEILNIVGVKEDQLCELAAPGEIVGEITKEASSALGLPEGIPLTGGGGDGQCAALGAGVVEEGRASLNMGTAVVSELYSEKYITGDTFRTMCGCVPRTYVPESIMAAGTFILNWYIKEFGRRETEQARSESIPVTKVFEDLAAGIGPGKPRLLMLPYLKGSSAPSWDPFAKGVMLGLCEGTTGAHFYRSIMEGIAFEQKFMYEQMEMSLNSKIKEIVLLGGGAKSPLWRQIIADITGIPILIPPSLETTCLGAGMLAAPAAGLYQSVFEASKGMSSVSETCVPIEKNLGFYKKIYDRVYRLLFPRIQDLVDEFTKLTSSENLDEGV
jgi:xylulokinase